MFAPVAEKETIKTVFCDATAQHNTTRTEKMLKHKINKCWIFLYNLRNDCQNVETPYPTLLFCTLRTWLNDIQVENSYIYKVKTNVNLTHQFIIVQFLHSYMYACFRAENDQWSIKGLSITWAQIYHCENLQSLILAFQQIF